MTDISKCHGDQCSVRYRCWRFLAPSDEYRQSFLIPKEVGPSCEDFWPVKQWIDEQKEKR